MSLSTNLGMQDLMKGHCSVLERFDNAPAKVALKHLYIANPCKSNSQTSLSENVLMIIIQYVDRKNINMMNFQQVAATKVQDGPRGFRAHSSSCGPLTSYAEAPPARHPLERPRTLSGWMSKKMGLADFSRERLSAGFFQ
jgi:hypothetical protein